MKKFFWPTFESDVEFCDLQREAMIIVLIHSEWFSEDTNDSQIGSEKNKCDHLDMDGSEATSV